MIAEPLPYTLLSLPRYGKILGLNPVHFAGAVGQQVWPLLSNRCEDVWVRQSWQYSDSVSLNDLALAIQQAEQDIASVLGYWPAPVWISNEPHRFTEHYMDGGSNRQINSRNSVKASGVTASWGKFVASGRRIVDYIGTATVADATLVYSDENGDSFNDTATITLPSDVETIRGVKVYAPDQDGDMEWEIRPVRNKTFSGENVIITIDSWLLINPDVQETPPNAEGFYAVDADDPASYFQEVDVYYELNDRDRAVQLFWEPESGFGLCESCAVKLESGAFLLLETDIGETCEGCGLVMTETCVFVRDIYTNTLAPASTTISGRRPDFVRLWYLAGEVDKRYEAGKGFDPLSDYWALTIAMLATARLERDLCGCANSATLAKHWREDLSFQGKDGSHFVDFTTLGNPFGTRRGEIAAWMRVSKLAQRIYQGAVI